MKREGTIAAGGARDNRRITTIQVDSTANQEGDSEGIDRSAPTKKDKETLNSATDFEATNASATVYSENEEQQSTAMQSQSEVGHETDQHQPTSMRM